MLLSLDTSNIQTAQLSGTYWKRLKISQKIPIGPTSPRRSRVGGYVEGRVENVDGPG